MATTILEYAPRGSIFKYIPNAVGSGCVRDSDSYINCTGVFALYIPNSNYNFIPIYECAFDTTISSSYFREKIPSQLDKTAVCWIHDIGGIYWNVQYKNYKKRKFLPDKGIFGLYHAEGGDPGGDFPVDASGYNDTLYFSDSSNFLYNPI